MSSWPWILWLWTTSVLIKTLFLSLCSGPGRPVRSHRCASLRSDAAEVWIAHHHPQPRQGEIPTPKSGGNYTLHKEKSPECQYCSTVILIVKHVIDQLCFFYSFYKDKLWKTWFVWWTQIFFFLSCIQLKNLNSYMTKKVKIMSYKVINMT